MEQLVRNISPESTRPLRHQVLWPLIARTVDGVTETDFVAGDIHLGVYCEDRLVSVGSLFPTPSPRLSNAKQYRLRAMATDPEFRGRHCGAALVRSAITLLKEKGVEVLWCDARLHATGFYEKLGFSMLEEVYEVPRIGPHRFMWIDLQGA